MSISQSLLVEFEQQASVTRRFLERLPQDKLTWKPHHKSMSAGQLAYHLAVVPGNVVRLVQDKSAQAPDFSQPFPQPASRAEILETLDESVATVKALLPTYDDAAMNEDWTLLAGERALFAQQRKTFLRNAMLSHWYQHRGQFSVYLRLLDIPVPSSWGPSADEQPMFAPTHEPAAV
ncbi:MAG: DinB family protein [Terracidiphilus sp.]|nr:DinB family protein [Terracidiphilus sp.]